MKTIRRILVCSLLCGTPAMAQELGDINENGFLDVGDLDLLAAAIRDGEQGGGFDMNGDGNVNFDDHGTWVNELKETWYGDSNLDGEFNSGDFVAVFLGGRFETGLAAGWGEGDWNGDGEFNSSDFIKGFQGGGFEQGPRLAVAVPEPSSSMLLLMTALGVVVSRRRMLTCD